MEFLKRPSITETLVDILLCAVPIWLAVMIGLVIGWSWRPRWTGLVFLGLRSKFRFIWTAAPPGFGARRLWLAFTALTAEKEQHVVTENDLEHLLQLLERKDGEMEWQTLMEKSTPNMTYQAWRCEPETGPAVYRTRTVFEGATPELVRDFFWDDEFRRKWDHMLAYVKTLEECPLTGTMIVQWIKKFPFFCSDREYIIGRRIWEAGKNYYCVTKGVPYPALPKRDKPRRVEHYFSSWVIRAVESLKGDGQLSACEVNLIHYEEMGIPKDVAKLAIRHGMWGGVKKLNSGMKAYQNARKSDSSSPGRALMASITTKISVNESMESLDPVSSEEEKGQVANPKYQKDHGIDWKWIVIGGTVAVVCALHSGAIGKALLLGAGRRIARR
ncbi:START domain-containing protein [Citrus sinensis]|uniref:START domain-containing protein n=1 Tax=Citrus sinensis TaxID=2711 RepID=A0ACB8I593_CITSI|nr:START domain-containing protein [Citrus sinensis]